MAKSSKLEDYWRQNNIESLFKELTHNLVQRMPSDPAVAIVQYLQKKFPKSFKTSTDNDNVNTISKTAANPSLSQSFISPRSPINILNTSQADIGGRPASNQSQISGVVTIPTVGSAFRDLLKQDTSESKMQPEINMRNPVFTNRARQQTVKLGKKIQSNRDIIDEELIGPSKRKSNTLSTVNKSTSSVSGDIKNGETPEQPPTLQLIKYKQKIRDENDRRKHREELAALAKQASEKELILQADTSIKSDQVQQQQKSNLSQMESEKNDVKLMHKPIAKSKREEDILNDEFLFQPRRERNRNRNRVLRSRSNTPYKQTQYMGDLSSTMRRGDTTSMSMTLPGVCKVCGSIINNDENLFKLNTQQVFAKPTSGSAASSVAIVDDWFESEPNPRIQQQASSSSLDDVTPQLINSNLLHRNLFQTINDNDANPVRHRPQPIITDNKTTANQMNTSRISESDIFGRTSESNDRWSPSPRSTSSPVTKKRQTNSPDATSNQSSKAMTPSSPLRRILESTVGATALPTTERRMSGWSVREQSPDDSDKN
ncbi:unnamed protein product [Rotaria magnacalcarata]|uniref:Uncharacterized protein n=4 Tax=Rotaria magnacalcarata TaxID=392030 RepID=A0A816XE38_9BILA|nr:unnamed protein product [Rotaria magnacalcarata]CAF3819654.1 unnamed protein product [Rotaria magnacalcarata]